MLRLCNLSLHLDGNRILNDVSFILRPCRLTALVGKNGSGKSSLLACVNQRLPYSGHIWYDNTDLTAFSPRERARHIAILPQTLPAPHITARDMAAFGRNPYLDFTGRLTQEDQNIIADALRSAGAEALAERYVDTLSGGERQRAAFAMILAQNTPVALLDEPTAHMDQSHEAAFLRMLTALKTRKTVLAVLHDLSLAVQYADDLVVLDQGRLVFSGTTEDCLQQGILERTFSLRRYTFTDQGEQRIFFSPT